MQIKNVGLFVEDLEGAKKFFEDYFDAKIHAVYNEEENKFYSYILDLDEGANIEIMTKPEIVKAEKILIEQDIVIFVLMSAVKKKLDEIIAKFHRDNYKVLYEPATVGGKEARAIAFEGNVIEVLYK